MGGNILGFDGECVRANSELSKTGSLISVILLFRAFAYDSVLVDSLTINLYFISAMFQLFIHKCDMKREAIFF